MKAITKVPRKATSWARFRTCVDHFEVEMNKQKNQFTEYASQARRALTMYTLKAMALLAVVTASVALAQFTAGVQGSLQDPSGAAIPNATVTLTNIDNQIS